jgi:4-hydroxybenzoate polyprenyltransferase
MQQRRTKNSGFSFIGFLQLTRFPNLIILGLSQYFVAIFLIAYPDLGAPYLLDARLFLLSSSTIIIAAAGYVINDYYDIKIDYVNKPEKVVVGKILKRRVVLFSHWILNVVGILIGFYLDWHVGLINILAAFLLWLYSNRLKRMPFIGNFVVAFLAGLSIYVVAVYFKQNVHLVGIYAVFAFSINLVREIIKDMEDIRGDMRFGSRTLPIIWGLRKTKLLLYALIVLFVLLLFLLSHNLANSILHGFFGVLVIPILYLIYLLYRADSQRRFHQLSTYCKLLMLAGITSMVFF